MVTFDFKCFNKLFSKLKTLINACITFYDEEFKGTYACTSPGAPFCRFIKENLIDKCVESDTNAFMTCINNDKDSLCYKCHFGLTEMSFRLKHNDKTYGYVIVGPFRTEESDKEIRKKIASYCAIYNISVEEMTNAYNEIPFFSKEKFDAIESLLYALFAYALNQKIILISQNDFIDIFDEYLEEHLSEDISINSVCAHFYLSQKQLYSIIKNARGIAPKAYIIQKRVQKAKYLIQTTELSLQQIAEQVGMPDYPHFYKAMKSLTGHSPNHYRKNN